MVETINTDQLLSLDNPVMQDWLRIQEQAGPMGAAALTEIARLRYEATHDALTGLYNRRALYQSLDEKIAEMQRDPSKKYALVLLDMDRFKAVNDQHGHAKGDEMLGEAGTEFNGFNLRDGEMIARLGGDEFAAIIEVSYNGNGNRQEHKPEEVVEGFVTRGLNTIEYIASRMSKKDGVNYDVSASVGYKIYETGMTRDEWFNAADDEMYDVKRSGGGSSTTEPTV